MSTAPEGAHQTFEAWAASKGVSPGSYGILSASDAWQAALAASPEPPQPVDLTTCNCRWRGEEQVEQCTLHAAHVEAIHDWAERAKTAERALLGRAATPSDVIAPQPAAPTPEGYQLVLVPKLAPGDEPDWDECIRQAEVATGLKVERCTLSIVIREVRRWLAQKAAVSPVSPVAQPAAPTHERLLLLRAMRQLTRWADRYGQWQPDWLPPAGDVTLAEDVDDFLRDAVSPVEPPPPETPK